MFTVPDLPYGYNALEPYIDEETMRLHHDKHHAAYVNNLNAALEKHPEWFDKTIEQIVTELDAIPDDVRNAVRNNGGGHANHSFFWTIMSAGDEGKPEGPLADAITNKFGSLESFQEQLEKAGASQFGSGWAWLVVANGQLEIISTPNQDSPLTEGKTPILGVDVWEHAYYLKYKNARADYLKAWWNVVNWKEVTNRFERFGK